MSETPMKNYENYVKLMDSMTINEELQKINAIHHSLNETNYITYAILLETNRKWFTASQILWIEERIANLQNQQKQNLQKSLESRDVELAKVGILEKSSDVGTRLF
jgi:dihydroneopterin aldolase